jgi:flagellar M-ring protein FliF
MAGGLLSKGQEGDGLGILGGSQFEHQQKLERTLENRIMTMLEPVIGPNRIVARVSAELDFGQVSIMEEKFDPDSIVIRSEQRTKETSKGRANMPSGSPDLQYQLYQGREGASGSTKDFQKEGATINYEINRTNKQITNSVGDIKRLSAAAIIDGPYVTETGADGKVTQKFVPRSRREMKGFEDIIKRAIGFNEARGDQVTVSNIPFALPEEEKPLSEKGPSWLDYGKKAAKPLLNIALVMLFFLFAIRPFKRWLNQAGQYIDQKALQRGEDVPRLSSQAGGGQIDLESGAALAEISKTNPDLTAEIIRNWISEGK